MKKRKRKKYLKKKLLLTSAKGKRSSFFQKKIKKKFDVKRAKKFFEPENFLETLSIVKPVCEISESFTESNFDLYIYHIAQNYQHWKNEIFFGRKK